MEKIPRPRIIRKAVTPIETEETFDDYRVDYADQAASQKYFPIAAYMGIIFAILLGAVIIGLSIIFASGKAPGFLGGSKINGITANTDTSAQPAPAIVDFQLSEDYPMLGSKDAPVTLIEFADFQCPYCKDFQDNAFAQIKTKYIDTGIAKFYYLHFPFLGTESRSAAEASECARQQGKFWEYHDMIFKSQGSENSNVYSDQALKKMAKQLGLNAAEFAACQLDSKTAETVESQSQLGMGSGVEATPTIFINGKKNEGSNPFSNYQTLIEQARAE